MSKSADALTALILELESMGFLINTKSSLHLSKDEVRILLYALEEWEGIVCLKDLSVSKAGLDWEEYENLTDKMKEFIE